jgi:hypothetical protein
MSFEDKKLGVESIQDLLQCGISTVEPYALMLTPVYVFMKLNDKLVSVKAPLDFFTPEELKHLSRYETFYMPKSVQLGSRFQTAAKVIRNLITPAEGAHKYSPATFEVSNEVLLAVVALWGKDLRVDPFFCAVFADELCGAIKPEKMLEARETAVVRHESGILISSVLTFILLHLGYFDLIKLAEIRFTAYEETVDRDESWSNPTTEWQLIARDVKQMMDQQVHLTSDGLNILTAEWSMKLLSRVDRVRGMPNLKNYESLLVDDEKSLSA